MAQSTAPCPSRQENPLKGGCCELFSPINGTMGLGVDVTVKPICGK
ncbi:hypothetical protein [Microbulbifer sp. PSTR4-B]